MWYLLTRSFLLFLLAVDWSEDPCFGREICSRPMASTEVTLSCAVGTSIARDVLEEKIHVAPTALVTPLVAPLQPFSFLESVCDRSHPAHASLYVLMSLQR